MSVYKLRILTHAVRHLFVSRAVHFQASGRPVLSYKNMKFSSTVSTERVTKDVTGSGE